MRLTRPLIFGLGGALLIWCASLLLPDRYTSIAMLRINVEPFPTADVINQGWQEAVSRQVLKRLIERLNLYPDERDRLPLEDVIENAKKDDITLVIMPDHDVLMTFFYRDPDAAKAMTTALMQEMTTATEIQARTTPGWGFLEVKQPVAAAERVSTGLAFWKSARYAAKGILLVRKQDNFKVDKKVAEQRARALRDKAFVQLRYSVESYDSIEELNRHLQIDTLGNALVVKLTTSDPGRAQQINSRLVNGLVDDNQHIPDCGAPPPDAPSPGRPLKSVDATPMGLPSGIIPDFLPPSPTATPSDSLLASIGPLHPDAAFGWSTPGNGPHPITIGNDCRDPNTPIWARTLDVLDPPSRPETPDGPTRPILALFGFFLGLGFWTAIHGR